MRVLVYEKKNVCVGERNSLGQKYRSNITLTCIAHLSSDHYQDYFTLRMSAIKIVVVRKFEGITLSKHICAGRSNSLSNCTIKVVLPLFKQ